VFSSFTSQCQARTAELCLPVWSKRAASEQLFVPSHIRTMSSHPQCLEIRVEMHGKTALECVETYYQYGRALLEQARESTDALGSSKVRSDVQKKDEEEAQQQRSGDGAGPSSSGAAEKKKDSTGGKLVLYARGRRQLKVYADYFTTPWSWEKGGNTRFHRA